MLGSGVLYGIWCPQGSKGSCDDAFVWPRTRAKISCQRQEGLFGAWCSVADSCRIVLGLIPLVAKPGCEGSNRGRRLSARLARQKPLILHLVPARQTQVKCTGACWKAVCQLYHHLSNTRIRASGSNAPSSTCWLNTSRLQQQAEQKRTVPR